MLQQCIRTRSLNISLHSYFTSQSTYLSWVWYVNESKTFAHATAWLCDNRAVYDLSMRLKELPKHGRIIHRRQVPNVQLALIRKLMLGWSTCTQQNHIILLTFHAYNGHPYRQITHLALVQVHKQSSKLVAPCIGNAGDSNQVVAMSQLGSYSHYSLFYNAVLYINWTFEFIDSLVSPSHHNSYGDLPLTAQQAQHTLQPVPQCGARLQKLNSYKPLK